jgi:hypothetical protein
MVSFYSDTLMNLVNSGREGLGVRAILAGLAVIRILYVESSLSLELAMTSLAN